MQFHPAWEQTHQEREWGAYPSEDLVRWTFRTFGRDYKEHRYKHIFDFGCGQGNNTWFLLREGFSVLAMDGSQSAARKAAQRIETEADVKDYLHRVVFATGDLSKTGVTSEAFDGVVDVVSSAHNTIHHLPDIYKEIARVLKPGGKYFLMTPTDQCSEEPFQGLGPITFLGETDLRLILQERFDIVELLKSSYQPSSSVKVEHWVVSATKRG